VVVVAQQHDHPARRERAWNAIHLAQEDLLGRLGLAQVAGVVLVVAAHLGEVRVALAALGVDEVAQQHEAHVGRAGEAVGGPALFVGQVGLAQDAPELGGLGVQVTDDDEAHAAWTAARQRRARDSRMGRGSIGVPSTRISKWRWGPVTLPVAPTRASI
jgi:hypothetical protein